MMRFETVKLNKVSMERNSFKEEVPRLTPLRDIEVKIVHKESVNVETGFNGRVNSYNGYTLDKGIEVGNVITRGNENLRVVWKDDIPRLTTLILEVV